MNLVFFGTSDFAVPILTSLAENEEYRPARVVTTPDKKARRGQEYQPSPVTEAAQKLGLTLIQPEKIADDIALPENADLFIVAAYGKILPARLLKIPKYGALNVHPSLLPRWRGPAPIQYTILSGDRETGVTIITMDELIDHGPIVAKKTLHLGDDRPTTEELSRTLSHLAQSLLLETIPAFVAKSAVPEVQDESQATFSTILKREHGMIDWSKPAGYIERHVRAFTPWPGSYTFWRREQGVMRLILESGEVVPGAPGAPGKVLKDQGYPLVQAGDGLLKIIKLTPEGKSSMGGQDFLRGHSDILGAILETKIS